MEPILTLATLVERPLIRVDKVDYALRLPDDFGLVELVRIQRMQRTLAGLLDAAPERELAEGEIERVAALLDELVALIVPDLPQAARGRLRDAQRLAVVQVFQTAAGAAQAARRPPSSPPTGAS